MSLPPNYIPLPPPPVWATDSDSAASPAALFYTPPETPPSPSVYYTPPTSPFDAQPLNEISPAVASIVDIRLPSPVPDDTFPVPTDVAIDLALDEEGLSTLEKIYLYSRSKAYHHRIFIAHELHAYLDHVTPQEAVEYVLPLLSGLAMDEDEAVKEALAAELIPIIWWFFSNCQVIPDDLTNEEKYASSSTTVTISVQAFTPILGTLLLNDNKRVGVLAREAIVGFLVRMTKLDDRGPAYSRRRRTPHQPWELPEEEEGDVLLPPAGLFGSHERSLFRQELLQQIVVGLGRLDNDTVYEDEEMEQDPPQQPLQTPSPQGDWSNPYFPPVSFEAAQRAVELLPPTSSRSSPRSLSPNGLQQSPSRHDFSPGLDFAPGASSPLRSGSHDPPGQMSPRAEPMLASHGRGSPMNLDSDSGEVYEDQGTLGRIACMTLVAAVTAAVPLDDETLKSFLDEVEHVIHDPYFRVRQAASFALGALAKEIPDDLVPKLLPLFDLLRWDAVWVVRHSALFALPAVIGRLSPAQRRTVTLETVVALSKDQNATVRCGVLECLGEVIHTFVNDADGPPEKLLEMFLGRPQDKGLLTGETETFTDLQTAVKRMTSKAQASPQELFYIQEKRPLICAFNFPAVVLTLGPKKWDKLRETYLDLAQNVNINVAQSLAASVAEIAKIIGAQYSRRDLLEVWRRFVKSEESEVRSKALECLADLIPIVGSEVGKTIVEGLLRTWNEDAFKSWREREVIQKKLVMWFNLIGVNSYLLFRDLFVKGLEDAAANVREAAISLIPELWAACSSRPDVLEAFRAGIRQLATSPTSRRRMTFIACQKTLVLDVDKDGRTLIPLDDDSLRAVADLASDDIEGVRIGVARFAALIYRDQLRHSNDVPTILRTLVNRLSQDASREVRSYVVKMSIAESASRSVTPPPDTKRAKDRMAQTALFSRPPISPGPLPDDCRRQPSEADSSDNEGSPLDRTFPGADSGNNNASGRGPSSSFHPSLNQSGGPSKSPYGNSSSLATSPLPPFSGQLPASSSNALSDPVSGAYHPPQSPFTYEFANAAGAANEQLEVPV